MSNNEEDETVDISDMSIYEPKSSGLNITDLVKEKQVQEKSTNMSQDNSNYTNIKDLAEDVNKSLLELDKIERNPRTRPRPRPRQLIKNKQKIIEHKKNYMKTVIDFLLLVTIYVVLSQPIIINMISKVVYQLKPTEKGIRFSGILIYGIILTSSYMSSRYFLHNYYSQM